jgi:hypothetical protein
MITEHDPAIFDVKATLDDLRFTMYCSARLGGARAEVLTSGEKPYPAEFESRYQFLYNGVEPERPLQPQPERPYKQPPLQPGEAPEPSEE